MKTMRLLLAWCFLCTLLPHKLQAQSNVYPAHAFEFDSFPERQFCPCVAPNTPIQDWPKCDSWDYRLTKGYSYVFSILNHTSVSCYQIGGTKVPDKELVRFVKPQSGWPDAKMFYYYFPEQVKVSMYAEKDGAQTLFNEVILNKDNRFTEVLSKKPVIGGDVSSFLIKLTSEANIKTLRMRVQPSPKSGNTISGDSKTFGSYSEVSNSDREIVLRYFMPTTVHENLANMNISIYDYNVPVTPTTPQGYQLYAPRFEFSTPPVTLTLLQERNGSKVEFEKKELKSPDQYKEDFKTKIAADGSDKTFIKMSSNEKIGSLRLRAVGLPTSGTASTDKEDVGILELKETLEKELTYQYTHPNHKDDGMPKIGIEVYHEATNGSIYKPPVTLVPAPVLMLHGIWSGGSVWQSMMGYLQQRGYTATMFDTKSYTNHVSFASNAFVPPNRIDALLLKTFYNKIIAGKVDVVAHSMGGLLTRQYIEGGNFRDDVNKFITLNTPHSGSQMANVVFNDNDSNLKLALYFLGKATFGGALEDLQVNGAAMTKLNQRAGNNAGKVAIHSVTSSRAFYESNIPQFVLEAIPILASTSLLKLCSKDLTPPWYLVNFNKCLQERVFFSKNDWIVSDISQTGGLSGANSTPFEEINHLDIHSVPHVQSWVANLLSLRNSSSFFSASGFKPIPIKPPAGVLHKTSSISSNGTIAITYPARNQKIRSGSTLTVNVQGNSDIRNIMMGFASDSMYVDSKILIGANKGTFSIKIPAGLNQKLRLAILGFDSNGGTAIDTMSVNISTAVANDTDDALPQSALLITTSPNPTTDAFSLQWNTFLEGDVEVYDLLGRQVLSQHVEGTNAQMSVSELPNGLYVIQLKSRLGNATTKLIKQ